MSDNFYLKRRSVLARKMSSEPIDDEKLKIILDAGIRVPDHGALNPWKIVVIKGEKLKLIDNEIILSEFKKENPNANKKRKVINLYFITKIQMQQIQKHQFLPL